MHPDRKAAFRKVINHGSLGLLAMAMMFTPGVAEADGGAGLVTDRTRPTIVGADGFAGEERPYHDTIYRWSGYIDIYEIRGKRAAKKAAHEGLDLGQSSPRQAQTHDGMIYESYAIYTGDGYIEITYAVGNEEEGNFVQNIRGQR